MTKFIYLTSDRFDYPIGLRMNRNLPIIKLMAQKLNETYEGKKLALWCQGSSGAIISGIIASLIPNIYINHVKKEGESSHSDHMYYFFDDAIHIIVDDFIRTGCTVNNIGSQLYSTMKRIDCLCISESVSEYSLNFDPDCVIAEMFIKKLSNTT